MARPNDELIPTRASLIQRLKNLQDQPGWQEFFDTYWKLLYGVARKAGLSDAEAQDVVQETLVCVCKHMPTFKYDPAIGSFKAWLLQLTRWRIKDQLRKRQPFAPEQPAGADNPAGTNEVEKVVNPESPALDILWDAEWERNLLNAAITHVKGRIDPQKFQIFDFNVNKAWPAEKVAVQFGVPVAQVYLAKHRVTEAIKAEVKRMERASLLNSPG